MGTAEDLAKIRDTLSPYLKVSEEKKPAMAEMVAQDIMTLAGPRVTAERSMTGISQDLKAAGITLDQATTVADILRDRGMQAGLDAIKKTFGNSR